MRCDTERLQVHGLIKTILRKAQLLELAQRKYGEIQVMIVTLTMT